MARLDGRRFGGAPAGSSDLRSDPTGGSRLGLNAYVDGASHGSGRHARAGAAVPDVMALQTAAGLENLAVFAYRAALALPSIGGTGANELIRTFATKTMEQHDAHGKAFNVAIIKLGGRRQDGTDPKHTPAVRAAVAMFKGPLDVIGLAIMLEDIAAQTYVKNVGLVSTSDLRGLFASVAGVESQHKAILLAAQALMNTGGPQLIALPPDLARLPGAAGDVGIPDVFFPTALASAVVQGALR